jgi:Flp pilus assembly protein protease CpaA
VNPIAAGPVTLVLVTVLTVGQLSLLGWYAARSRRVWEERGISALRSWAFTLTVALTAGAVTYPALLCVVPQVFPQGVLQTVGPWEASGAALTVFLTTLASCTDMASYRIPRDITLLTAAVAVPNMIAGLSKAALVGVGFWGALVVVLFLARRLLPMGDVRLLFTLTFTLSWWVSVQWMLYAFILAQGLFVIAILAAKLFHFGSMEPRRAGGKPHLHLPLAPALTLGYLTAIAATALTGINACTSLYGAVSCQRFG